MAHLMDVRHPRAPRLGRGLSALVLALFALGWLCDRAHVAFEAHDWCEEHQRVEHAEESGLVHVHQADAALADLHADGPDDRGPAFEAVEADPAAHAACCVLLARGGDPVAVPLAPTPAFVLAAVPAGLPPIAWEIAPRGSVPILALAPKQSPPVA